MPLIRSNANPVLSPDPLHSWESFAVFNPTVIRYKSIYTMLYRAMGDEVVVADQKLRMSVIGKATSQDGYIFSDRVPFIVPEFEWEKYGCEDPRATAVDDTHLIFYTALSANPPGAASIKVAVALSKDLKHIDERHLVTPFNAKAMTLFPGKVDGKYAVVVSVDTDDPPSKMAIATFDVIHTLWDTDFWYHWYDHIQDHIIPVQRVNSDGFEVGAAPIETDAGWMFINSYIKHYHNTHVKKQFRIEGLLLDKKDPRQIVGRIEEPMLTPDARYEKEGVVADIVFPESALIVDKELRVYYGAADTYCALATMPYAECMRSFETSAPYTLKCTKFPHNPLLQPIENHEWERASVFNPAAVEIQGTVYLVYRASTTSNVSYIGMAVSHDGEYIDERLAETIYPLRAPFEKPKREGMGGGCEDPRITRIGDRLHMLYTAYDGEVPRLAMTSISIDSFLRRDWSAWREPIIISPPGISDKDGMLFPEKVGGKYVFFHRIEPNICIDLVDDLEFKDGLYLKSSYNIAPQTSSWEGAKIGINTPPLKTADGWLIFYHGISHIDHHYRIGALLLDLQDVTKVIGRTPYPILEPETEFERHGVVNNVVFPCGFVYKNDMIYLYYGGADKVVCGGTLSLQKLLKYLKDSTRKSYLQYLQ